MICCKDLCLDYPDGTGTRTILENVNINIEKGESIVLLGPSGSGKSSLIYLLSGLRMPTKGDVFCDGKELTSMKADQKSRLRHEKFGFVFQTHFLLPYLSVIENVLSATNTNSKHVKEQAGDLLEQLGLGGHIKKRIYQLSGGERQRVAIARALIHEPDVIFADEPTASLDHNTACEVVDILKRTKKDSIFIMATHDTSILSGDERVIRIMDKKAL